VSNRIDTIRKCLNSVKPLLDALPSELIVVDTVGPERSDGSLAVAREFTDKIVHFTWCDDFAAARNAGLERARGEWFLFLDDDEWFDDVSEIIDFLKTEDGRYNTCIYRVRNYKDRGGRQYADGYVERLVRRSDKLRFKDRIHEYLVGALPELKALDAFVHHYGYIFESQEAFEKHSLRNLRSLEKALEEKPGYLRAVTHLAQEYLRSHDYEKAEALCREALEKNDHPENSYYISVIAFFYVHVLIYQKKWKDVSEQSERIMKRSDITELAKAGICYQLNECAYALFDSEMMLSNVDEYFRLMDFFDADPDKLAAQQINVYELPSLRRNISFSQDMAAYREIESLLAEVQPDLVCAPPDSPLVIIARIFFLRFITCLPSKYC
jgi:glycosyltransferase involved in cell wall biosynthesis